MRAEWEAATGGGEEGDSWRSFDSRDPTAPPSRTSCGSTSSRSTAGGDGEEGAGGGEATAAAALGKEFSSRSSESQPLGPGSIDADKKQLALIACADLHVELVNCLKQGFFADCSVPQKAFWECYAKHRALKAMDQLTAYEPPSKLKSKSESLVVTTASMEDLSHDVLMKILATLPRSSWFQLRRVCKAWKKAVEDPYLHQIRVDLECTEEWCYTEAWDPATRVSSWYAFDYAAKKWYALPSIPRRRGLGAGIYGRASTSLRGELYVLGGRAGASGPTLRDMYIYSPATNRWRKCRQGMITTRHSPFVYSFCRKIFVLGGFDWQDNLIKSAEYYDVETQTWTCLKNINCPEVICPSQYRMNWQVQWTALQSHKGELYVSYKTREAQTMMKFFSPELEEWFPVVLKDKAKALLTYSLAGIVNKNCVMLDWPKGLLRATSPFRKTACWLKVQGMADLDWVSILRSNPKVSYFGSMFVIVTRRLSVLMIETHPDVLEAKDREPIQKFTFSPDGPELEPLKCVVVVA